MSLYLFLLCAEGFISLISYYVTENKIQGVKINRHAPSVMHIFLADDSLVFLIADLNNDMCFKDIIDKHEFARGQKINFGKLTIFFSPNCNTHSRDDIKRLLVEKYLTYYDWEKQK